MGEAGWFVCMGDKFFLFKFGAWGWDVADVAAAWTWLGTNSRARRHRLGHSAMPGSSGPAKFISRGASCSWLGCAWDTSPSWPGRVALGTFEAWGAANSFSFKRGVISACKALVPRGETGGKVVEWGGLTRGCCSWLRDLPRMRRV